MKIAIYGGTFDPCHEGHLEIIKRLSKTFDKVIVVPTTIRYYKKNAQMFAFDERFFAIKMKCEKFENVEVSDIERFVDSDWRFIDTVRKLTSGQIMTACDKYEYYVAIGSDSFQKFETWCDYEEILKRAKLIVFRRPGYEDNFPNIPHEYVEDIDIKISSTELREKLRKEIYEDFDEMIDDITFCKGFEDEIENYKF
jgi:nicotinate-nucleotide adenylyltransferase